MEKAKLKHLVWCLRLNYNSNKKTANIGAANDYTRGIESGMKIANEPYLDVIERLEALIEEMSDEMVLVGGETSGTSYDYSN